MPGLWSLPEALPAKDQYSGGNEKDISYKINTLLPKIALGVWSWDAGAAGGDPVFGNHLFEEELKGEVFLRKC